MGRSRGAGKLGLDEGIWGRARRRQRHCAKWPRPLFAAGAIALVGAIGASPALAAGGNLAWTSYRDGNPEIYVAPADGTGSPINVSSDGADDVKPSLSADGNMVAWTSYRDGNPEIYVAPANGTGPPINVSDNGAGDVDASLSGDGNTVAWVSNRDGNGEVFVASTDGTGTPTNISKSDGKDAELEAAIAEIPGDVLVVLNASAAENRESVPGHPGAPWTQAPADVDQWAAWARSVMDRLIPLGVTHYQVWNEPNLDTFFNSTGDNLIKYRQLIAATGAAAPEGVTLYSAGISNENDPRSWTTSIAEYQGAAFDVLAIHPYHYSDPTADLGSTVASMLPDGFDGPYAITEYGTPNEADHAMFLSNARAFHDAEGVPVFYYTLTPEDGGGNYALYPSEPDGGFGEPPDADPVPAREPSPSSLGFGAANGFDYPDAYERSLLEEGGFDAVRFDVAPGVDLAEPSLSAEGNMVAWTSFRDGNPEIYVAPADGTGAPINVSTNGADDFSPRLSADGGTVAWTSYRDGNPEIYVAPADGTGKPVNASNHAAADDLPSLSGDGRTVAWRSGRDGVSEIYVAAADGSGMPSNVSTGGADDVDPSLSADGGTVAWGRDRDGDTEIYVTATDGSGPPINVSTDSDTDLRPSLARTIYIAVSSIADGAKVTESVPWQIDVRTIGAVDRVEFVAGGRRVGTDTAAPYVSSLDPAAYPNGPLALEARVFATPSATSPVASVPLNVAIANPSPPAGITFGPTPTATPPVCARVQAPTRSKTGTVELSVEQVRINQRIYSAGVRRAAAIERWLADGIVTNDLCAGGLTADPFGAGIMIGRGDGGPVRGAAPIPRPIIPRSPATKSGVTFDLSARQLQINQRIASALVRRANALRDRLDAGLTGGDVRDGEIEVAKLSPEIAITGAAPVRNPPGPTSTKIAAATSKTDVTFTLSPRQLRINQRIGSAAIRRLNAVRDRLLTGLATDDFKDDSITAVDLAPGVAP